MLEGMEYIQVYGRLAILSFLSFEESLKSISHLKIQLGQLFAAFEESQGM